MDSGSTAAAAWSLCPVQTPTPTWSRSVSSLSTQDVEIPHRDSTPNVAASVQDDRISIRIRVPKVGELTGGLNPKVSCLVQSCSWTGVHTTQLE